LDDPEAGVNLQLKSWMQPFRTSAQFAVSCPPNCRPRRATTCTDRVYRTKIHIYFEKKTRKKEKKKMARKDNRGKEGEYGSGAQGKVGSPSLYLTIEYRSPRMSLTK
jgi:hypothetical protein